MIYPFVYSAFFAVVIAIALRRRFGEQSRLLQIGLFPFAGMVADYLENAGLLTVLFAFPERIPAAAWFAAAFNGAKWTLFGCTIPLALVSLLDSAVHGIRRMLGAQVQ